MKLKRLLVSISIVIISTCFSMAQVTAPSGGESFSLEQLKDSALQHNIAMRKGRLKIAAAKEQRKEAFTKYFPNISAVGMTFRANREMAEMTIDPQEMLSPETKAALAELAPMMAQILPPEVLAGLGNPVTMSMMKKGTIAGVNAIQPVFTGGQIILGNKLARIGEEVSHLQLQLSEKDVEAQVEQYYWQLLSMHEKMRTLDAVEAMLGNIEHDVQTAVRAGVALNNDLLQVQLRQNDIKSQRLKLNNGRTLVKMLLGQFCGLNGPFPGPSPVREGGNYQFEIEMPDISQVTLLPSLIGEGLGEGPLGPSVSTLPEYQLLEKNVEAAKLQRKMEIAKNMPNIAVGAGYNYHNLLENDRHFGMIFASVNVPISGWWGGAHAIRKKKFEEQEAREQLTDNAQQLQIRIQKAANDISEAQSQLALAQQSVEQATENLRIQRNTYRAGTSTMSDLLEAQLMHQQTLDQRTDAFVALQNALLAYRQATGQ